MVVDANHELFSRVGIIGRRTQVIQLVSLYQSDLRKLRANSESAIFFF